MANPEVRLVERDGVLSLADDQRDLYCPFRDGTSHCGRWCPLLEFIPGAGPTPDTLVLHCAPQEITYDIIIVP